METQELNASDGGEAKFAKQDTATGEENEEILWKARAKLFRFDVESSQWKERGTGEAKLLQDNDSKEVRFLMRRDHTHKPCANHFVSPTLNLKPNVGSDRSWVWNAPGDMADGAPSDDVLAIRFQTAAIAKEFFDKF